MTTNKARYIAVLIPGLVLSGCMNMPTPSAQITGSYASSLRYEDHDCRKLAIELESLARRENQLAIAQEQRIKTSQMQAFWWGFGQGDGIEATELANVRGEKEAVRKAIESNACHQQQAQRNPPQMQVPEKAPEKTGAIVAPQSNLEQVSPYVYELKKMK